VVDVERKKKADAEEKNKSDMKRVWERYNLIPVPSPQVEKGRG
jgi:hypothetical protein